MRDFLAFRTMVTPLIIQVIFWLGAIISLAVGAAMIIYGATDYDRVGRHIWKGVLLFCLGPLAVRVYCEILIIFFRMNETLTEIKHAIEERQPPP